MFAHICVCTHARAAAQLARGRNKVFTMEHGAERGCEHVSLGSPGVFLLLPRVYQSKAGLASLGEKL